MQQAALITFRSYAIGGLLFVVALIVGASAALAADGCPTGASEISTDRPDVTNSSRVVPYGSLRAENGVDWTVRQGSDVVSGTETRLRLGIARCTEVVVDVPTYFYSLNGHASSGFSDLVVSVKRELPVPFGFHLSATGGLGFPTSFFGSTGCLGNDRPRLRKARRLAGRGASVLRLWPGAWSRC
jgi:hypothetical protein